MLIRGLFALLCCLVASPAWAFPENGVLEPRSIAKTRRHPHNGRRGRGRLLQRHHVQREHGSVHEVLTVNPGHNGYVAVRLVNIGANTTDGYQAY